MNRILEKQVGQKERLAATVAKRLEPGSEFSYEQLCVAAMTVARRNDPPRDSTVLREARRRAEMLTPKVLRAWWQALGRLRTAVPEPTFKLWLEPLSASGAEDATLFLAAPDDVRAWVERRYSSLIRDALTGTPYTDVQFVSDLEREGATCR